jgi:hypothetical protein
MPSPDHPRSTGAESAPHVPSAQAHDEAPQQDLAVPPREIALAAVPAPTPAQMLKLVQSLGSSVFQLEDQPPVMAVLVRLVEWNNLRHGPIVLTDPERDQLAIAKRHLGKVVEDHLKMQESLPAGGTPRPFFNLSPSQRAFKALAQDKGLTAGASCFLVESATERHPGRIVHVSFENGQVVVALDSGGSQRRVPAFRLQNTKGKAFISSTKWTAHGFEEQAR